jgi:hypothetical protein
MSVEKRECRNKFKSEERPQVRVQQEFNKGEARAQCSRYEELASLTGLPIEDLMRQFPEELWQDAL